MDVTDVTCCVVDHGDFLPLARALGGEKGFGQILFVNPSWQKAGPVVNEGVVGDGFPDLKWVPDIYHAKKMGAQIFVFPDVYHLGDQLDLREQGYAVWGAGRGMNLELDRTFFLDKLDELHLDVPKYDVVVGITALRDYLREKEDIYIKVSFWRGSWETKHWRSWKSDAHHLDLWAVRFGGVREIIQFLCFEEIDTKLELGCDSINIDGKWPALMLHGIEKKDEAYLGAVTPRQKMPEELLPIMEAFSPYLRSVQYRCQWSMEVRVTDTEALFIDATTRGGLPSTGSQIVAMENLAHVIWAGAHGELLEPIYKYKFTAECMVKIKGEKGSWEPFDFDPELRPWLMLSGCSHPDGRPWFSADDESVEEVGWLVSAGQTPMQCCTRMNELADLLPDGADAAVEALADIIREVEEAETKGIQFTDAEMPDPEVVLEPS